jgi:tetratricopeptide (TPR) repeat protein
MRIAGVGQDRRGVNLRGCGGHGASLERPPIMRLMRSLSKSFALFLALVAIFACCTAATGQDAAEPGGRVVLVLPFENHSGNPSLSWIGDSFPDTLNKRLDSAGFLTISHDDRAFAYDHMGLPVDFRPTRATTIRIAQVLDANFVIIGNFNVVNDHISIQARVLSIDGLKLSAPIEDSAELSRLFDAENAVAWKVAGALDPRFSASEQTFLGAAGAVSLPAFEDYIRGSTSTVDAERLKRLQNAVSLTPGYADALLALGKEQYAERDFDAAAVTLAKVPATDRLALEANFYLGLARFNSADYVGAEKAFGFVAGRLPLPEVVNNEGVALSRQGKDGVADFQRASAADPSDEDYHYNLAIALYRRGDTAGATREVEEALKLKSSDNEATQLRTQLKAATAGSKLNPNADSGFSPLERIRRSYSETGFRQAAFQLDEVRAARMAMLPAAQRATEYTQLGRQYLAEGLLPEAETQFQFALAASPNSADAHAGMAQLREASGDAAKARDEAKTSLIMKPNVAALLVLARLDMADKQLAASASDVSRALQVEPTNAQAIALRLVLQQRGQTVQ